MTKSQLSFLLLTSLFLEKGALYPTHIMLFYIEPIFMGNCNLSLSYLGGARNGTSPRRLQSDTSRWARSYYLVHLHC